MVTVGGHGAGVRGIDRGFFACLLAIALLGAGASAAFGHAERLSYYPDWRPGKVPDIRHSGPALVVCKPDSKRRILRIFTHDSSDPTGQSANDPTNPYDTSHENRYLFNDVGARAGRPGAAHRGRLPAHLRAPGVSPQPPPGSPRSARSLDYGSGTLPLR